MGIWRFAGASLSPKRQGECGSKTAGIHVSQPMTHRRVLPTGRWLYIIVSCCFDSCSWLICFCESKHLLTGSKKVKSGTKNVSLDCKKVFSGSKKAKSGCEKTLLGSKKIKSDYEKVKSGSKNVSSGS